MADSRNYSYKKSSKIELKVERQNRTILFLSVTLISILLTLWLQDPVFTQTQTYVMFLLFFAIGLWITEAVPPFAVGILIVGFLVFTMGKENAMDAKKYVQTWSDGVIWLFLGGFFLAEAMKKVSLDKELLRFATPKFGNQQKNILLGLMMTTAALSMLMSNTATTAMMIATIMPLLVTLGKENPLTKALLIAIPTAASIGGMGTIIGSAPNAIAVGALQGIGIRLSFLDWMIVGIPTSLIIIIIFWKILLKKYKLNDKTLTVDFSDKDIEKDPEYVVEDKIRRRIVLIVLITTLLLWLTSQWTKIPVAAVSGLPIVVLTLLGIIDADDVRALPWDTLMLVAGGLALGLAIQEQGLAAYFVSQISNYEFNLYALILVFALITVLFSNFMSNTAATTIFIPIALSLSALNPTFNPIILPLVIGLSASCALFLPVSTPPNAIAYSTGLIDQKDFRLGGVSIGLSGPIIIIFWTLICVWLGLV